MRYYRLLTDLPPLPDQPERPPIPLDELTDALRAELPEQHWKLAEALLTRQDVLKVEELLRDEETLPDEQGSRRDAARLALREDGRDLPPFLQEFLQRHEEGVLGSGSPYDSLWQEYHRYLLEVADESSSRFLQEWLAWDVPLLNALARWRAGQIGTPADAGLLDEPHGPAPHEELVARVGEEGDPLARERLLDAARLSAIDAIAGSDPFSLDALLAYLTSAMVLQRWDLPQEADPAKMLEVFE